MEFGLGAFLEKIEEHLGKRVLKIFLILVVGAASLFCAKMIWDIALGPVARTASGLGVFDAVFYIAWLAVGWVIGGAITTLIAGSFVRWREARAYKAALRRAEAMLDDMREFSGEQRGDIEDMITRTRALMEEIQEMHSASRLILQGAKDASEKLKPGQP
jgi:hypothetical protein